MKLVPLFLAVAMAVIFSSCKNDPNQLSVINSESFHESQIQIFFQPKYKLAISDSLSKKSIKESDAIAQFNAIIQLDEMLSMTEKIRKSGSDSLWIALTNRWTQFNSETAGIGQANSPDGKMFPETIQKWAELNVALVKLSGEVRFGDAIEKMLHGTENIFIPEQLIKSVIFTHIDDRIYINVIAASSMEYHHTTGGNVKLIQDTNYPKNNTMILKSVCNDTRFMEVNIRIPSWAVNPTVTHGNVKYVARPGEYCQISRKWNDGDEFQVVLKN